MQGAAAFTSVPAPRPTNYARSLMHFTSAAVGLVSVALLSRGWLLVIACSFATYAWTMEAVRRISPRFNERLMRFYASVAHPQEYQRVNSATWFATALVIIASLATRPGMMAGLAVLGVADPIAGIVGRRWGRRRLRAGRSLEGTAAFFVSGTIAAGVALMSIGAGPLPGVVTVAVLSALAGALAELATSRVDDNLMIPVVVSTVASFATAPWLAG